MRFYHPWRLSLLRPSFISHGQPHVPLWSDHDDRPESDDEIFHQTSKSERRVLFHTRITVSVDEMGGSWDDYRVLRVLRVVRWIFPTVLLFLQRVPVLGTMLRFPGVNQFVKKIVKKGQRLPV